MSRREASDGMGSEERARLAPGSIISPLRQPARSPPPWSRVEDDDDDEGAYDHGDEEGCAWG
jgi:hypothetical protein